MLKTNKLVSRAKLISTTFGLLLGSLVVGLVGSMFINLPMELVASKRPSSMGERFTWILSLLLAIALIAGSWGWYYQNVKWPKWLKKTTLMAGVGVVSLVVIEVGFMALNVWLNHTATTPNNGTLSALQNHGVHGVFNLTVVVMAPMMEEFIYRGTCQRLLSQRLRSLKHGAWWGIGVSSLAFGLAHQGGNLIGQLTYILMGVVLGVIYQRTRDLRACTLAHAFNNWLAVTL
ncbi:CPBP family intramembrane glutamic endopeptidase [uncultured Secundilactobacillus sp.]|uniref:CPBP family intramembrane glutamic endopeptidase n=1 Tax=uncultured Secundilactobacillus sp. TaxID=2813935 RepID=UPI0025826F9D|nr:type II CAAX endopeptidase family protein [uncultured Secundilactobacillus sp.]